VRRLPAAAAAVSLLAIALVGCSATPSPTCEPASLDDAIGDRVTVTGDLGETPEISVPSPLKLSGLQAADLIAGDGRELVATTQVFGYSISIVDASNGRTILSQGYDDGPSYGAISSLSQAMPGLEPALLCASQGSRVAVGLPTDQLAEAFLTGSGLAADSQFVVIVDIDDVLLPAANGVPQYNDRGGLPTVVLGDGGRPGVIIPDNAAPDERVVEVLKKGEGEIPAAGATSVVNYSVIDWDAKSQSSSTWDSIPEAIPLDGSTLVSEAIAGLPIGSQVMVVDPAVEGSASGATVYVIDLLGVIG
jgi:hypothetical protein